MTPPRNESVAATTVNYMGMPGYGPLAPAAPRQIVQVLPPEELVLIPDATSRPLGTLIAMRMIEQAEGQG